MTPTYSGTPASAGIGYCTLAELKAAMPEVTWGSTYDAILTALIERASRLIDGYHRREPGAYAASTDAIRYFTGSGRREQWIGELAAAPTTVQVAEQGVLTTLTTWAATDYLCWPYNAIAEGLPILRLDVDGWNGTKTGWPGYPKAIKITGKWGFSASPPAEIVEAAIIQATRWYKRGQQAFADAGAIFELGQLRYVKELDPDVRTILSAPKFTRLAL